MVVCEKAVMSDMKLSFLNPTRCNVVLAHKHDLYWLYVHSSRKRQSKLVGKKRAIDRSAGDQNHINSF